LAGLGVIFLLTISRQPPTAGLFPPAVILKDSPPKPEYFFDLKLLVVKNNQMCYSLFTEQASLIFIIIEFRQPSGLLENNKILQNIYGEKE
jgi:hypothetical protein